MSYPGLQQLREKFDRFVGRKLPMVTAKCPAQLREAWGHLLLYESGVVGCVSQLIDLDSPCEGLELCRLVLKPNPVLDEELKSAACDAVHSLEEDLVKRKAELDELVKLAHRFIEEIAPDCWGSNARIL